MSKISIARKRALLRMVRVSCCKRESQKRILQPETVACILF